MTEDAIINALTVDMALGCSTNSMLHIPAIAGQSKLKTVVIGSQFIQSAKHGLRILGPKHNAINHLWRYINLTYLMWIHRIPHIDKAFLYSVEKPF